MTTAICERIPNTGLQLDGFVGEYIDSITSNWLLVAPKSNPSMLEMFQDRDAPPLREMVPWAGEFAGKYLTASVQMLRVTGNVRLKQWLNDFVRILVSGQAADGYLGPWPKRCRLTNTDSAGRQTWDTWGHYHVMLGLIYWDEETDDPQALACACRIADLLCRMYLGEKKIRLVDTGATEMNLAPIHALCVLYRKTQNKNYLGLALQILDEFGATLDGKPLAGDYLRQALLGKEFFETPKPRWESLHAIMALAELYWITGETQYRQAFEQIWWSIAKFDRHNNGGFSSGEKATGNPYHPGAIESCCTIAWTAMGVEMLKLTGSSIVADELELSMFNSIVGMHSSSGHWATYNTPMNGIRRASAHAIVFQSREGSPELNCCSVNTPRGFGILSEWALMKEKDSLILNYYGPSTLCTRLTEDLSVTLAQETDYPLDGSIVIQLQLSISAAFTLKLRIPQWSRQTQIRINDDSVSGVYAGTHLTLNRTWNSGDKIFINLDMSMHFWRGEKECDGLSSVYRGPILLAYDHRYNLDNANGEKDEIRDVDNWDSQTCMLNIPPIDAQNMGVKRLQYSEWLPPLLLVEVNATNGKTVRLCDFASAGETGTPYCSWLPVNQSPTQPHFSEEHPLPTCRI